MKKLKLQQVKIDLKGSKVKGDEVELKAKEISLEKGENRKDANETNANIGVTVRLMSL